MRGKRSVRWAMVSLWALSVAAACGGAAAEPKPGAVLTGPIEVGAKGQSAEISLWVSGDGQSITRVVLHVLRPKCEGWSNPDYNMESYGNVPISGGRFRRESDLNPSLKGEFTSPTSAQGSIDLKWYWQNKTVSCGTFHWSAEE